MTIEFLGFGTYEGISRQFRRHYAGWFSALFRGHLTTFARQAANLWKARSCCSGRCSSLA